MLNTTSKNEILKWSCLSKENQVLNKKTAPLYDFVFRFFNTRNVIKCASSPTAHFTMASRPSCAHTDDEEQNHKVATFQAVLFTLAPRLAFVPSSTTFEANRLGREEGLCRPGHPWESTRVVFHMSFNSLLSAPTVMLVMSAMPRVPECDFNNNQSKLAVARTWSFPCRTVMRILWMAKLTPPVRCVAVHKPMDNISDVIYRMPCKTESSEQQLVSNQMNNLVTSKQTITYVKFPHQSHAM